MKLIRITAIVCLLVGIMGRGFALPYSSSEKSGFNDWMKGANKSSLGIIDPSRLSVSHSTSFSASFSNGNSLASSLIASHFTYQFSNPLTLRVSLGMLNNRFGGGQFDGMTSSALVGGFSLDWRPSNDFFMRFNYSRGPTSGFPSTPDLRPFPYSSVYPDW